MNEAYLCEQYFIFWKNLNHNIYLKKINVCLFLSHNLLILNNYYTKYKLIKNYNH